MKLIMWLFLLPFLAFAWNASAQSSSTGNTLFDIFDIPIKTEPNVKAKVGEVGLEPQPSTRTNYTKKAKDIKDTGNKIYLDSQDKYTGIKKSECEMIKNYLNFANGNGKGEVILSDEQSAKLNNDVSSCKKRGLL